MKMRVKRRTGRITGLTLISEDQGDKEVLEALWYYEVSRHRIIYRQGMVILQGKVGEFPRR